MSFTYIASPYSHPDPETRRARYLAAMEFTAWALNHKIWAYSPIVHCHDLAIHHSLPYDFNFWQDYNRAMICVSRHLIVLQLDGWKTSRGVAGEILIAEERGIPISYMYPSLGGYQFESNKDSRANPVDAEIQDGATPSL